MVQGYFSAISADLEAVLVHHAEFVTGLEIRTRPAKIDHELAPPVLLLVTAEPTTVADRIPPLSPLLTFAQCLFPRSKIAGFGSATAFEVKNLSLDRQILVAEIGVAHRLVGEEVSA